MATRLDHLEMVLERPWYNISNCRHLPSSDRSALVSGCTETTAGVENEGQAVKPAWHWAADRQSWTRCDTEPEKVSLPEAPWLYIWLLSSLKM